ncbi:GNAT family N-acetyltransferase [Aeromicrobium sp. UC242_57]|uniref:GNAT family N-acetyltransferase n=1 Tax=Aeromicrobium sp. UC242_57 TaxID=3374624 RepID=UPI0037A07692
MSRLDGWPLIPVASVTRESELVCLDPGLDEFIALSRHIAADPRAMLTVVADDITPYRLLDLPVGTRVDRDDETLMTTDFAEAPIPALDDEFTFRWDVDDHRLTYSVESGQAVAAVGTVGILGDTATFDAVETTPAFQRRGLGRHVMATLSQQALGRGARRGVLAASGQGRQLYLAMGWQPRLEMLSLMGA